MAAARKKSQGGKAGAGQSAKSGKQTGSNVDLTVGEGGLLNALRAQVRGSGPSGLAGRPNIEDMERLPGIGRAARLLLALGPDQAAGILKELEPAEIERLVGEMAGIDRISADEKKAILAHFDTVVKDFDEPVRGGTEAAKKILQLSHGEDVANEIIGRISQHDLYRDFEFLERIDAPVLASTLSQEHHQIAAVALSFLKPKIAAAVMRHLPADFRSETALRIAKTARIHPEAVQRVARVLREKFEKRTSEIYSEVGGADTLANILNQMERRDEDEILDVLGKAAPNLVDNVRDRLYTFEELTALDHKEMRLLIARVGDDEIMAAALRGAGDDIRRHFFNSMSQNRAADILEEIDRRGPLSIREINDARAYILNSARRLDEEGALVIKKDKDEYI